MIEEDWEDCLGEIYEARDIDLPTAEEMEEMAKYFGEGAA